MSDVLNKIAQIAGLKRQYPVSTITFYTKSSCFEF
jgi:hypothetical protein